MFFISVSNAQYITLSELDRINPKLQLPFGNLDKTPYFGNVVYAAQPDLDTVKILKDQGFDLIINIRELNENIGFDEKKLLEKQGILYVQIPYMQEPSFNSEFSDVALNKIKLAIDDGTRKGLKILLHCSHGQRVASTLGAILYRDYGYTVEEAFEAANKAGMMSVWSVPRFYRLVERLEQMVPANVTSTED